MRRFLLPLAAFIILVGFLAVGLQRDPREVPSPLVGKPAPQFALPTLHDPAAKVATGDFAGKVWLLNVWASWCVSCRDEHPVLVRLRKERPLNLVGLNYKDGRDDALAWLERFGGNPYVVSAFDADGRAGIDFGVYGVPETFVIDKKGVIRYKHIGPITPAALGDKLLPLVAQLEAE